MSDDLPGALAEIAAIVGREAALDLAEMHGGRRIYIPRPQGLGGAHQLVTALGDRDAVAVAMEMSGQHVDVPFARRALARRLAERGHRPTEIARRLGISLSAAARYAKAG